MHKITINKIQIPNKLYIALRASTLRNNPERSEGQYTISKFQIFKQLVFLGIVYSILYIVCNLGVVYCNLTLWVRHCVLNEFSDKHLIAKVYTRAQMTSEYAILITVIVMALVGMQLYLKRGIQARLFDAAEYPVRSGVFNTSQFEPWYSITNKTYTRETTDRESMTRGLGIERTGRMVLNADQKGFVPYGALTQRWDKNKDKDKNP